MENSIFAVYKPKGITSAKFLNLVKKSIGKKIKMGHAGTLDPNATGLLIVGTGSCTKLLGTHMAKDKIYIGTICFGYVSDTYDDEGKKVHISDKIPELKDIEATIKKFIGIINQIPPAYSAVHINGKRAHELARANKEFVMPNRKVTIYSIDILEYNYPILKIKVKCGTGTYIRSLAKDIGDSLGCGAYLKDLERIACGKFELKNCIKLDDLTIRSS